jgi:hypothetical protein
MSGLGGNDWLFGELGDDALDGGSGTHDIVGGGQGKGTCLNGEDLDSCETTGQMRTLSNRRARRSELLGNFSPCAHMLPRAG